MKLKSTRSLHSPYDGSAIIFLTYSYDPPHGPPFDILEYRGMEFIRIGSDPTKNEVYYSNTISPPLKIINMEKGTITCSMDSKLESYPKAIWFLGDCYTRVYWNYLTKKIYYSKE